MDYKNDAIPIYVESLDNIAPLVYQDHSILPNSLLVRTKPYMLTTDEVGGDSVVNVPANSSIRVNMTNDRSGAIDIRMLKGTATSNNYTILIHDGEHQRDLSNRPIHAQTIIGSNIFPFKLRKPHLILHEENALILTLRNLTVNPNIMRFNFQGQRYYFDSKQIINKLSPATKCARPFFYTTDEDISIPVGVGTAEQTAYITMIRDADFYCYRMTAASTGIFRMKISDTSSGLDFSNGWIHSNVLAGTGLNYVDEEAMLYQRTTKLRLTIINMSGADNDIYFTMTGNNFYYRR